MLLINEIPVYSEHNSGEIFLFPGVSLKFKWRYGENFFRTLDRYGRSKLFVIFPVNAKIEGDILVHDESHTTFLVWGTKLEVPSGAQVLEVPDITCPIPGRYYNILSAPKGTSLKLRDEDGEDMTLVF